VRNEIEGSQSWQRSNDGIEECLSQQRSAKKGVGKECECIIGGPVGIKEPPILG